MTEEIRRGDIIRYWPGDRLGLGYLALAESDPIDVGGVRAVRVTRHDKPRGSRNYDAIALSHVERVVPADASPATVIRRLGRELLAVLSRRAPRGPRR